MAKLFYFYIVYLYMQIRIICFVGHVDLCNDEGNFFLFLLF